MTTMNEEEKRWKFAQCFGDKVDSDDITEGILPLDKLRGLI